MNIEIRIENINSSEAIALIDELSAELERITGNSGRGSFERQRNLDTEELYWKQESAMIRRYPFILVTDIE